MNVANKSNNGRMAANTISTIALAVALLSSSYWAYTLGRDGWFLWIVLIAIAGLYIYRTFVNRK